MRINLKETNLESVFNQDNSFTPELVDHSVGDEIEFDYKGVKFELKCIRDESEHGFTGRWEPCSVWQDKSSKKFFRIFCNEAILCEEKKKKISEFVESTQGGESE